MDIGEQRRAWLDRRQFRKAVQHAAKSRRLARDIIDGLKDPNNYVTVDPSQCIPSS